MMVIKIAEGGRLGLTLMLGYKDIHQEVLT